MKGRTQAPFIPVCHVPTLAMRSGSRASHRLPPTRDGHLRTRRCPSSDCACKLWLPPCAPSPACSLRPHSQHGHAFRALAAWAGSLLGLCVRWAPAVEGHSAHKHPGTRPEMCVCTSIGLGLRTRELPPHSAAQHSTAQHSTAQTARKVIPPSESCAHRLCPPKKLRLPLLRGRCCTLAHAPAWPCASLVEEAC
jgi:hypothetical protein